MKEIILTIDKDGEIKLETKGFKGKSCKVASQYLKDLLGEEMETELTPAYFEYDPETDKATKKFTNLCG